MSILKKVFLVCLLWAVMLPMASVTNAQPLVDLKVFHSISSHDLLDYATHLSSDRFKGRMSGSPEYIEAAKWVAGHLETWGLKPGVGDSSFFQWFPNAWTEVLSPGSVTLFPSAGSGSAPRELKFPDDFYPGSNSATGNIYGEVVYTGFGITALELGYDDYAGIDVRNKIVMIEAGVPYAQNDENLSKWEPYSYHRYKLQRAHELGAVGVLYVGLVANPNTSYIDGFVVAHISEEAAQELLNTTGRKFSELKNTIVSQFAPQSFPLQRRVGISATTMHHPNTMSCNVVGIIEGGDPMLQKEAIIVGAHLDGVGSPGMLFPGALDNASGVADIMAAAKALAMSEIRPDRTIIFVFFGGEECGLYGSSLAVSEPLWDQAKTRLMINLDMVGNGTGFHLAGAQSHPELLQHFVSGNQTYLHRSLTASEVRPQFGRPRTDGAVFEKAGYTVFGLYTTGSVKPVYYHHPLDNTDGLTPEIMEDAAKLLYLGILGIANDRNL